MKVQIQASLPKIKQRIVCGLILCVVLAMSVLIFFTDPGIRTRNVYTYRMLREIRIDVARGGSIATAFKAGRDMPESIEMDDGWLIDDKIWLYDPYDPFWRGGRKVAVRYELKSEEVPDFSFRGRKLKTFDLGNEGFLVYSNGPDEDNDLAKLEPSAVVDWAKAAFDQYGDPISGAPNSFVYDPSNGMISDGDIIRMARYPPPA